MLSGFWVDYGGSYTSTFGGCWIPPPAARVWVRCSGQARPQQRNPHLKKTLKIYQFKYSCRMVPTSNQHRSEQNNRENWEKPEKDSPEVVVWNLPLYNLLKSPNMSWVQQANSIFFSINSFLSPTAWVWSLIVVWQFPGKNLNSLTVCCEGGAEGWRTTLRLTPLEPADWRFELNPFGGFHMSDYSANIRKPKPQGRLHSPAPCLPAWSLRRSPRGAAAPRQEIPAVLCTPASAQFCEEGKSTQNVVVLVFFLWFSLMTCFPSSVPCC